MKSLYSTDSTELKMYLYEYIIERLDARFQYNSLHVYSREDIDLFIREVIRNFWEDVLILETVDTNYFSILDVIEAVYLHHVMKYYNDYVDRLIVKVIPESLEKEDENGSDNS